MGNIIFLAAILLIIARFLTVWTGTPFPLNLVTAQSMYPSLMEGDVVAWTPTTIEDVDVGDVVVFKSYISWPGEKLVIHRVSDIKTNSKGEIFLETKGDANNWTDQSGPHIPEPYIREDHLLGKAISIGKVPLKIPFVGYIGVWANKGLESISQPTSSKGSLSYIGIFTPLVISIMILAALIFILPEKARTIKEKIRYYIFGLNPVKLKKIFFSFVTIYIVFLTVIHCFAYDSTSGSLGINADSTSSSMNFGRMSEGDESFPRMLPVINPSIMSVKGVVFGRGEISKYITRKTFHLEVGETDFVELKAVTKNNSINGTFYGDIMVYSSPFWAVFPDELMQGVCNWNADLSVIIFDVLTALYLTSLTVLSLVIITFVNEKYNIFSIDRSWRRASKIILKRDFIQKVGSVKNKAKKSISKNIGWLSNIDIAKIGEKETPKSYLMKPVLASTVVIPALFFISDQILAMIIAVIVAGIVAYFISCKLRRKIVLTVIITLSVSITYMMIDSNLLIIAEENSLLEIMALSLGAMGIFLLILGIFLIPLSLLLWFLINTMRNLKERKEPLLALEGKCDL